MSKIISSVAIVIVAVVLSLSLSNNPVVRTSSVSVGGEYRATTTHSNGSAISLANHSVLKTGNGTLGSVVITLTGNGTMTLYDASTTINGAAYPTTTLATFGASVAAGTYTFDLAFYTGLLVDYTGNVASTTITFR